ncbi:MAG: hypothetical protein R2736_03855 [Solirubrobacterales bacterium]
MNADLSEVAADPAVPSVDFLRTLPKRVVESPIGSTPDFDYAMRMVQVASAVPAPATDEIRRPCEVRGERVAAA